MSYFFCVGTFHNCRPTRGDSRGIQSDLEPLSASSFIQLSTGRFRLTLRPVTQFCTTEIAAVDKTDQISLAASEINIHLIVENAAAAETMDNTSNCFLRNWICASRATRISLPSGRELC